MLKIVLLFCINCKLELLIFWRVKKIRVKCFQPKGYLFKNSILNGKKKKEKKKGKKERKEIAK